MNEVKRDNETLREIKQFQLSIENLVCNYHPFLPAPLTRTLGGTPRVVVEEKIKFLMLVFLLIPVWEPPRGCLVAPVTNHCPGTFCHPLSLSP